jgi:predicted glycoside hydrolase/deacetylase ChbG (UPF0249 family)
MLSRVDTLGQMSRLIVNADDFGYTAGINQAIESLFGSGALSSTTAMATGQALPESAARVPAGLRVGCHVVLVDGRPAASGGAAASLLGPTARLGSEKQFRPTLGRFALDLQMGRVREQEIEAEAVAQIEALQVRGFAVTHVDTHKHTHLFPRVLRPLLRAARTCGVTAVRNPFEPQWAQAATPGASGLRRLQMGALGVYRRGFLREVAQAGMRTTSGALGVLATGVLDEGVLRGLLSALVRHGQPGECYELVCHPGVHDGALDAERTRLRAERARELAALRKVVPEKTGTSGEHRLVSFADL